MMRRKLCSASIWICRTRSRVRFRSSASCYTLAGEIQVLRQLLEGQDLGSVHAVAALDDPPLLVVELREPLPHLPLGLRVLQTLVRVQRDVVRHRLADREHRVDVERRVERGHALVQREHPAHFARLAAGKMRHVLHRRLAIAVRLEVARRAQHRVELLDDVHWQADSAGLVHDRPLDALADPPCGIRGETEAALGIELLQCVDEPEIALLDQIGQRHAAVHVVLRDVHHEPQVVLDHGLPGVEVALPGKPRVPQLFVRGEQRVMADFVQVELHDVREQIAGRALDVEGGRILFQEQGCLLERLLVSRQEAACRHHPFAAGRYLSGSTGLPCRLISKWSLT